MGSPIFTCMSRTPVKTSNGSQASDTGESVVVRLGGAFIGGSRRVGAEDGLSFILGAGEAHVITGPAGCGKTALLDRIALARPPDYGVISLFGGDAAGIPPAGRAAVRRRIGVVFQHLRLIDTLSARDNVALAARAAGRAPGAYDSALDEVLAWVGLARRADEACGALDAEGRGRLAMARAVINRPDLLIVDEPTGEAVLKLLSELNRAGTTMLIATRDTELAMRSGAEVTHLAGRGRVG